MKSAARALASVRCNAWLGGFASDAVRSSLYSQHVLALAVSSERRTPTRDLLHAALVGTAPGLQRRIAGGGPTKQLGARVRMGAVKGLHERLQALVLPHARRGVEEALWVGTSRRQRRGRWWGANAGHTFGRWLAKRPCRGSTARHQP